MPSLRVDSAIQEYSFTEQEARIARILTPLQVMWFQTQYALAFKAKASQLIPTTSLEDRTFLLAIGEIEGRLTCYQSIIQDSIDAQKEQMVENITVGNAGEVSSSFTEIKDLSERASSQVHDVN